MYNNIPSSTACSWIRTAHSAFETVLSKHELIGFRNKYLYNQMYHLH